MNDKRKLKIIVPDGYGSDDSPPTWPDVPPSPSTSDHERLNTLERVLKHSVSSMISPEFPRIADAVNQLVFHPPFTLPEERKGLPLGDVFDEGEYGRGGPRTVGDEIGDRFQDITTAYISFLQTISDMIPTNPTIPNPEYHTEKRILDVVGGDVVATHQREYLFIVKTDDLMGSTPLVYPHALWLIREPGESMLVTMIAIHATVMMTNTDYVADEIILYGMKGKWPELAMSFSNESPFVIGGSPFRIDDYDDTPSLAVKTQIHTKGMWSQHGFPTPSVFVANYYASSLYKLRELLQET